MSTHEGDAHDARPAPPGPVPRPRATPASLRSGWSRCQPVGVEGDQAAPAVRAAHRRGGDVLGAVRAGASIGHASSSRAVVRTCGTRGSFGSPTCTSPVAALTSASDADARHPGPRPRPSSRPGASRSGEAPYRARQVLAWVHRRGAGRLRRHGESAEAAAARGWPQTFAIERLEPAAVSRGARRDPEAAVPSRPRTPTPAAGQRRSRACSSRRSSAPDGARDRLTLCISSQAGCGMGCGFCATARMGLVRNLRPAEIVGQVRAGAGASPAPEPAHQRRAHGHGRAARELRRGASRRSRSSPPSGAMPSRRAGSRCRRSGSRRRSRASSPRRACNLAVSLHAPTDASASGSSRSTAAIRWRRCSRPAARCRSPAASASRSSTCMLAGENDADGDARALVRLLHGLRAKVNLIPFNPVPRVRLRAEPARRACCASRRSCAQHGIAATIRESRGQDIQAACGQLAVGAPRGLTGRARCPASASSSIRTRGGTARVPVRASERMADIVGAFGWVRVTPTLDAVDEVAREFHDRARRRARDLRRRRQRPLHADGVPPRTTARTRCRCCCRCAPGPSTTSPTPPAAAAARRSRSWRASCATTAAATPTSRRSATCCASTAREIGFLLSFGTAVNYLRAYYALDTPGAVAGGEAPRPPDRVGASPERTSRVRCSRRSRRTSTATASRCRSVCSPFFFAGTIEQIALGFQPDLPGHRGSAATSTSSAARSPARRLVRRAMRVYRGFPTGEPLLYDNIGRQLCDPLRAPDPSCSTATSSSRWSASRWTCRSAWR